MSLDELARGAGRLVRDDLERLPSVGVEEAGTGVVVQRQDGCVLACSASAARLVGLPGAQLCGRAPIDPGWEAVDEGGKVLRCEEHPSIRALDAGEDVRGAVIGVRRRGERSRWLLVNARLVTSPSLRIVVSSIADTSASQMMAWDRERLFASLRFLVDLLEAKHPSTAQHSDRVGHLSFVLALELGWSAERAAELREAALLHDIGKVSLPDALLLSPNALTAEEYAQIKRHAVLGARIGADALSAEQAGWVRHHHEHWDGRGYPDGLLGTAIPSGARLLALADAWDVITSGRAYSARRTRAEAQAEIEAHAGSQFCPEAVDGFARVLRRGADRPPRLRRAQ